MSRYLLSLLYRATLLLLAVIPGTQATTLQQMYVLAMQHDPSLQAAIHEKLAEEKEKEIGRAGLLPQAGVTYKNAPYNRQSHQYESTNIFGQSTGPKNEKTGYRSSALSVSVTQPLFDYEAWARYQGSVVQSLMADEHYRTKYQEMVTRLINAYIEVSRQYEYQQLVRGEVETYQEQLALNEKLYRLGEGTYTDVAETLARYRMVQAEAIDKENALEEALNNLSDIVGLPVNDIKPVIPNGRAFSLLNMKYPDLKSWLAQAGKRNPELKTAQYRTARADYEVKRSRGAFLPKVELYAAHTANDSINENTTGQKYSTNSIGIQVSMPLYNGGATSAGVAQAKARYLQTSYELSAESDRIHSDIRRNYNLCRNSAERIKAYEQALKAAESAVLATRQSLKAGMRINMDVLNADRQRMQAARELSEARYDYLKAWTALQNGGGEITEKDLAEISRLFLAV